MLGILTTGDFIFMSDEPDKYLRNASIGTIIYYKRGDFITDNDVVRWHSNFSLLYKE